MSNTPSSETIDVGSLSAAELDGAIADFYADLPDVAVVLRNDCLVAIGAIEICIRGGGREAARSRVVAAMNYHFNRKSTKEPTVTDLNSENRASADAILDRVIDETDRLIAANPESTQVLLLATAVHSLAVVLQQTRAEAQDRESSAARLRYMEFLNRANSGNP